MIQKLLILFLAIMIGFAAMSGEREKPSAKGGGGGAGRVEAAPLNEEFVRYVNSLKNNGNTTPRPTGQPTGNDPIYSLMGATPPPWEARHIRGFQDSNLSGASFPAYFDLRKEGKVIPWARNQESFSCWFHATMTSLESCLMPEARLFDAETPNLFTVHGFTVALGGDYRMSAAVLLRWDAPTDDKGEIYNIWRTGKNGSVQKHVQQVVFPPERAHPLDNAIIKEHLMKYGAAYFTLRYEDKYFNFKTNAFYCYGTETFNHGVSIVGWDDHFSREKFNRKPEGDGAFIARNSWGQTWGENGYFYVSYHDKVGIVKAVFNNAESAHNYRTIYQLDPLGAVTAIGAGTTLYWAANVFTAKNNEPITAVGFYTTDVNTRHTIHIYRDVYPGSPINGQLAIQHQGEHLYPGFYTVLLPEPVPVAAGERFAVVVRFQNSAYKYPVSVETPIANYSELARALPGESFISKNGTEWTDLTTRFPNTNACIKAYSQGNPDAAEGKIFLELAKTRKNTWLLSKVFCRVRLKMEGFEQIPWSRLRIYAKTAKTPYYLRRTVSRAEVSNGEYTVVDDLGNFPAAYTYHVTAYNAEDAAVGRSNEAFLSVDPQDVSQ